MLTEKYKVSGDDFYVDTDGTVVLPLGTITIQETKAPDGYLLEGATLIDKDGNTSNVENGVFIKMEILHPWLQVTSLLLKMR